MPSPAAFSAGDSTRPPQPLMTGFTDTGWSLPCRLAIGVDGMRTRPAVGVWVSVGSVARCALAPGRGVKRLQLSLEGLESVSHVRAHIAVLGKDPAVERLKERGR